MEPASNSKPDSELVAEFKAGDGASRGTAFRFLYERHAGRSVLTWSAAAGTNNWPKTSRRTAF
jgi:hypothetical protein